MQLCRRDDTDKLGRFELRPHTIKLGGIVNDTELYALASDYTTREVTIDWKPKSLR